jgi:hypothetical protein
VNCFAAFRSAVLSLAAIGMLAVFPAAAGQSCDNNGRCTTFDVNSSLPGKSLPLHVSKRHRDRATDANGNNAMVNVKTAYGFNITVHPAYAGKFLRLFALMKERGYKVPASITKCWTPRGTRVSGSNHYIGAACDIQTGWNRGPAFIYHMSDVIKQAGLYDGCSFRDCGHIEAVRGTHNSAPNLYAAIEKFKTEQSTANYQP